jgi:hypothetical protein
VHTRVRCSKVWPSCCLSQTDRPTLATSAEQLQPAPIVPAQQAYFRASKWLSPKVTVACKQLYCA